MYHELIFRPLYNGLIGIMDILPFVDIGIAVIIFTVVVKVILFPLSKSSILTQIRMKEVEPEMNKIKAEYAKDRQLQAMKVMELYKTKGIRPFAGILLLFIQLPFLFALISVFYKIIPTVNPDFLYSFISAPDISTRIYFLGLIDLSQKSFILALLTGVLQFLQIHYSPAMRQSKKAVVVPGTENDFSTQLAGSMQKQMKFMLPIIAFASTYWLIPMSFPQAAAIIAIYWSTSTVFTLAQEIYIRRQYEKKRV
ncbi:MAG: YidC/Oxa1 family membrane protein insertase [Patescibacteria group bacterium]